MPDTTTIQVQETTAKALSDRKGRGDSYDDVVRRLLEVARELEREPDEVGGGHVKWEDGLIKCQNCGYEWTTESTAERPTCPSCQRKTERVGPDARPGGAG